MGTFWIKVKPKKKAIIHLFWHVPTFNFFPQPVDAGLMLLNESKRSHYNVLRGSLFKVTIEDEVLYCFLPRYVQIYN